MKRKIVITIILIVACILLIGGGILLITTSKNDTSSNDKVRKTLTNSSPNLQNTHCLNDLCIKSMDIKYSKENGEIEFVLENTGQTSIQGNYLKLIFDKNEDLTYVYRYDNIDALNSVNVVIEFQEKELIDTIDYEIKELSTRELHEIKTAEQGNATDSNQ